MLGFCHILSLFVMLNYHVKVIPNDFQVELELSIFWTRAKIDMYGHMYWHMYGHMYGRMLSIFHTQVFFQQSKIEKKWLTVPAQPKIPPRWLLSGNVGRSLPHHCKRTNSSAPPSHLTCCSFFFPPVFCLPPVRRETAVRKHGASSQLKRSHAPPSCLKCTFFTPNPKWHFCVSSTSSLCHWRSFILPPVPPRRRARSLSQFYSISV